MKPINVHEFEIAAKLKLDLPVYDFIASGACDEYTLRRNQTALQEIQLLPRILHGIDTADTTINILDGSLSHPLFVSPLAYHQLAHEMGELATAKAMNQIGLGFTLSTMSSVALEKVAAIATCPLWFQLYIHKDRAMTQTLIQRAELAGFKALVLTVDVPILGKRERDLRHQFQLPQGVIARNFFDDENPLQKRTLQFDANVKKHTDKTFNSQLTWEDIKWVQKQTKLPLILKGIMHPDDAKMALNLNVAAIIVSNHGGRQLDGMPATIDVLPNIANITNGNIPLLIDGGFRRGTDIFKALALGADCVMIGRPVLWALACSGIQGVIDLFKIYSNELQETMLLCGCKTIEDIKRIGKTMIYRAAT